MIVHSVYLDTMWLIPLLVNVLGLCFTLGFAKDTRVSLTSPVNPVEEGGVIGIHCQVMNLKDGQEEVSILKLGINARRLTLDDDVLADGEDIFIAKRQIDDGSLVFFLSIIGAKRDSAGDYRCRVTNTITAAVVAHQDVTLDVTYFPDETDPICTSNVPKSMIVEEGSEIKLNCSSHVALPEVSISWKSPGAKDQVFKGTEIIAHGRKSSTLTIRPKLSDSGNVYLCEIRSRAFHDKLQTCHIGPITVRSNGVNPRFNPTAGKTPNRVSEDPAITAVSVITSDQQLKCTDICSTYSPQRLYWIVGTAAATVIALIFFVLVMVLCVKYHKLEDSNHNGYAYPKYPMEKIYSEVESRRVDDRVYMSLVKLKKSNDSNCLEDMTHDGRYLSPTLEIKQ